jgi:hypothetical protein
MRIGELTERSGAFDRAALLRSRPDSGERRSPRAFVSAGSWSGTLPSSAPPAKTWTRHSAIARHLRRHLAPRPEHIRRGLTYMRGTDP